MVAFFTEVLTLAIGALYAPEGKDADYAARAVRDLRVFFLDEQTRVNPHMTYAQGIPGVCTGRGIGMIDSRNSWQLFDAIGILDAIGAMPEEVLSGVKRWFNAFLDWTLTSEIGADEDLQHNNHGTWFDVQVAATALFLGRRNLAKDRLMSAYDRRLAKHIMPDGRQPFELARTDAPGYSSMNLRAWTLLGKMAKRVGIKTDYFGQIPTGFNAPPLLCALEYLAPYGADVSDFPYQNIHGGAIDGLIAELSYLLAPEYPEAALKDRSEKPDPAFPGEEPSLDRLPRSECSTSALRLRKASGSVPSGNAQVLQSQRNPLRLYLP